MDCAERRSADSIILGEAAAEQESDGADEEIFDATDGIDLDGDSRGIATDEFRRDSKEEFFVPGRVFAADGIETGSELG